MMLYDVVNVTRALQLFEKHMSSPLDEAPLLGLTDWTAKTCNGSFEVVESPRSATVPQVSMVPSSTTEIEPRATHNSFGSSLEQVKAKPELFRARQVNRRAE